MTFDSKDHYNLWLIGACNWTGYRKLEKKEVQGTSSFLTTTVGWMQVLLIEEWNAPKRGPLSLSLDLKASDLHRYILSCGFPPWRQQRNVSFIYLTFINLSYHGSYSHMDENMVLTFSVSWEYFGSRLSAKLKQRRECVQGPNLLRWLSLWTINSYYVRT